MSVSREGPPQSRRKQHVAIVVANDRLVCADPLFLHCAGKGVQGGELDWNLHKTVKMQIFRELKGEIEGRGKVEGSREREIQRKIAQETRG